MTPQKSSLTITRVVAYNGNATGGNVGRGTQASGITCGATEYAKVNIVVANLSGTNAHTVNCGTTGPGTVPGPAVRIDNTLFQITQPINSTSTNYQFILGPGQTLFVGSTSDGVTSTNSYWYVNAVFYINS